MMMSPFDWRSVLLARHAQHVAVIHFPIGLFIAGVAFDFLAHWTKRTELAGVAYWNFVGAALMSVPTVATGLIAWQWALEGQRLKGTLLLHLLSASASFVAMWLTWWLCARARRQPDAQPAVAIRLGLESLGVLLLMLTGHLGGFLSGVNGAP